MRKLIMAILAAGALAVAPLLFLASTAWAYTPVCVPPGFAYKLPASVPVSHDCNWFKPAPGSHILHQGDWIYVHDVDGRLVPIHTTQHATTSQDNGVTFLDALGLGIAGGAIGFAIAELARVGWTRLVRSDNDDEREKEKVS